MIHSWIYNNTFSSIQQRSFQSRKESKRKISSREIYLSILNLPFLRINTINITRTPRHKNTGQQYSNNFIHFDSHSRLAFRISKNWSNDTANGVIRLSSRPPLLFHARINSWARCPRERPRGASHVNVKRAPRDANEPSAAFY